MNDVLAAAPRRYALSFTTGALLAREAALLAPVYLKQRDWEQVRALAVQGNLLQARTHRTGVRLASETVQRLSTLTDDEVGLLIEATGSERASPHVGCRLPTLRVHRRVRRGGLAGTVPSPRRRRWSTGTLMASSAAKALWHEELAKVKDSTMQRLRSNVFKMLREAELLSEAGEIMPAVLSERVAAVLSARSPSDLRFFPTRQANGQEAAR